MRYDKFDVVLSCKIVNMRGVCANGLTSADNRVCVPSFAVVHLVPGLTAG